MSPKTILLLTAGAAAVYLPLAVSAQEYYSQLGGDQSYQTRDDQSYNGQPDGGQSYRPRGDQPYFEQPGGDWYGAGRMTFRGYPEFRQVEAHIRAEINDGVREDLLAPEDAADFKRQLRAVQADVTP